MKLLNKADLALSNNDFYQKYGRKKIIATFTLGCKVNQYETEAMKEQFLENGYVLGEFEDYADVKLINTCTVTKIADRKSRQMIQRARRQSPQGVIVAVGCHVEMADKEALQQRGIDVLIGNRYKSQVLKYVSDYVAQMSDSAVKNILSETMILSFEDVSIHPVKKPAFDNLWVIRKHDRTRATVKIQDGCNQYCSFCIIPYVRGDIRSRRPGDIVKEIRLLADQGYQEFVLTGIHISSYGKDFGDNYRLIDLLETLNQLSAVKRIRLGSLEPRLITPNLVNRLMELEKICPHFHLSLQSGSDSVLRRMRRHYLTEDYRRAVELLRKHYRWPAVTTDVIVGFPGETDEEAEATYSFLREIGFADTHIFKYSPRSGTKAAELPEQIADQVKHDRSQKLIELSRQMDKAYCQQWKSQVKTVLIERRRQIEGVTYDIGYTKEYVKVYIRVEDNSTVAGQEDGQKTEIGRLVKVRLTNLYRHGILGVK